MVRIKSRFTAQTCGVKVMVLTSTTLQISRVIAQTCDVKVTVRARLPEKGSEIVSQYAHHAQHSSAHSEERQTDDNLHVSLLSQRGITKSTRQLSCVAALAERHHKQHMITFMCHRSHREASQRAKDSFIAKAHNLRGRHSPKCGAS